jgi:hypothetical protein
LSKPFAEQITAAKKEQQEAAKEFIDRMNQLEAAKKVAEHDLIVLYREAAMAGDTNEVSRLAAQIEHQEAWFKEKTDEVSRQSQTALKPFDDRMTHLFGEREIATFQLHQQIASLHQKANEASEPYMSQQAPILRKVDAALEPLKKRREAIARHEAKVKEPFEDKAQAIVLRATKKTKKVDAEVKELTEQLAAIIQADTVLSR